MSASWGCSCAIAAQCISVRVLRPRAQCNLWSCASQMSSVVSTVVRNLHSLVGQAFVCRLLTRKKGVHVRLPASCHTQCVHTSTNAIVGSHIVVFHQSVFKWRGFHLQLPLASPLWTSSYHCAAGCLEPFDIFVARLVVPFPLAYLQMCCWPLFVSLRLWQWQIRDDLHVGKGSVANMKSHGLQIVLQHVLSRMCCIAMVTISWKCPPPI